MCLFRCLRYFNLFIFFYFCEEKLTGANGKQK
uniref:Uncharacterized protein n=1 Tax=Arundo donax TaxID=35708 RepID=A0A0A8Y8M3_ARUDO